MTLLVCAQRARHDEEVARLQRALAVRAMTATGMTQQVIASELGISQPAVSQLLRSSERVVACHPALVVEAAAPIFKQVAADRGFGDVAVFGSVARGDARQDSDIDLVVRPAKDAQIAGRPVDVVTYTALKKGVDDDILRDLTPL